MTAKAQQWPTAQLVATKMLFWLWKNYTVWSLYPVFALFETVFAVHLTHIPLIYSLLAMTAASYQPRCAFVEEIVKSLRSSECAILTLPLLLRWNSPVAKADALPTPQSITFPYRMAAFFTLMVHFPCLPRQQQLEWLTSIGFPLLLLLARLQQLYWPTFARAAFVWWLQTCTQAVIESFQAYTLT
jgi:hypothetical protein